MTPTKARPVRRNPIGEKLAVGIEPPPGDDERDDERDKQHHREAGLSDVALEKRQTSSKGVAERAEERRPGYSAQHVVQSENAVRHLCRSGEQRGPGAKDRDEPAEEDGFGSVPLKERVNFVEFALVEMDVTPVTLEQRQTSEASYPVTSGVADDSARCCNGDHPPDRQMAKSSECGGGYENRFTWQRDAEALDGNEEEYDRIAVGFDEPND